MNSELDIANEFFFDLEDHRYKLWDKIERESIADWRHSDTTEGLVGLLTRVCQIERYWAYPGREVTNKLFYYLDTVQSALFSQLVKNVNDTLKNQAHRSQSMVAFSTNLSQLDSPQLQEHRSLRSNQRGEKKKIYFEVLIIHPNPIDFDILYRNSLASFKTDRDEFLYDIIFVDNAEDAMIAILANPSIQAVVFLLGFQGKSLNRGQGLNSYYRLQKSVDNIFSSDGDPVVRLSKNMDSLRPELDHYYICETALHQLSLEMRNQFNRIIYHVDPFQAMHHAILNGISGRYSTPFFHALQAYSRKPHGVFHALPLSQGKSLQNSHWIKDMLAFYGDNTFLAETSSTQGGLDSLLDPKGAIKQSQHKIASTFGSAESFLVTNGTSTSNKIVMQSTLCPGDIVIISADCHKSIPYSVMLTGALPLFLETYSLRKHDLFGGVTLERIKEAMLDLKANGKLHLLKQITLTNSTFDGLVYNTEQFMLEILAIKPDIVFHWDEAWFAFASFNPIYSGRTAMSVTKKLKRKLKSEQYCKFYHTWKSTFDAQLKKTPKAYFSNRLYPNPDEVILRVYVTQSTHKTLTSFRQGSMIHVDDEYFDRDLFYEAYRMHTSTSPNYQILASLDVGRRQASLEGYERVKKTLFLALELRCRLCQCPKLSKYFTVLSDRDLVPDKYRSSEPETNTSYKYTDILPNWGNAQFVVDPTRVTVDVSKSGMDGSSFRQLLMDKFDIQVNKTSRNTVLFIVNIGSTMSTINYLLDVLKNISEMLELARLQENYQPKIEPEQEVDLPQRRYFSKAFKSFECSSSDVADMRSAYYAAANRDNIEYVPLNNETLKEVLNDRKLVSASFVTPYPPGFPVLTPGQIITYDILLYLQKIKIKEIHGFEAEKGLKVFKKSFLDSYLD